MFATVFSGDDDTPILSKTYVYKTFLDAHFGFPQSTYATSKYILFIFL